MQSIILITVGLLIAAAVGVIVFAWQLIEVRDQYDALAKPIILKILLEEEPNLQDLSHKVNRLVKESGQMTAFRVDVIGPGPINILRGLERSGLLALDESWKTRDRARWGKYKHLVLSQRGREFAESYVAQRS